MRCPGSRRYNRRPQTGRRPERRSVSNLTPDMVVHRVPDVQVHIDSSNNVRVVSDDVVYYLGPHGLAVLDAFYQPVSMSEALEKLSARTAGAQDWIALTTTIMQLYEAGILQDETQRKRGLEVQSSEGYGSPTDHVDMLNDRARTSAFLSAIEEVVRPGDVVLDVGTGTGVFAVAAARAGARHVYAIEASGIAEYARSVFEANGLADRITLLQGWSTQLSLPERADVLVSEMVGAEPLGEDVLEMTLDARIRLLKPGARLIPGRLRILGLPMTIPQAELAQNLPTAEALRNWCSWYGIDFGPLSETHQGVFPEFYVRPQKARHWEALSEPVLLVEVDLQEVEQSMVDSSVTFTANASGRLDGLMVYFEQELGPTTSQSTHPERVDEDIFRSNPVWALVDPLETQAGDRFKVTYQYRVTRTVHRVDIVRA